jgi:hypothetical protein
VKIVGASPRKELFKRNKDRVCVVFAYALWYNNEGVIIYG